jgi:hypothetical protein
MFRIFIGYEPRQAEAYMVSKESVRRHAGTRAVVQGVLLNDLMRRGWYLRPTNRRFGALIDELSIREGYNGELSTEHANARFFVPYLARSRQGWAIFMDNDTMVRSDMDELFQLLAESRDKALMCVHHNHNPLYIGANGKQPSLTKMDNQVQTSYERKNWSSMMAFNLEHPANDRLTPEMLNTVPGRDLHRFCWLHDDEIGELSAEWNWLVRVNNTAFYPGDFRPKIVHWTLGGPWLPAFSGDPFSDEWFDLRDQCVLGERKPQTRDELVQRLREKMIEPPPEMARPAWLGA